MVKLRLTRTGRKNYATYRIVAIDSKRARDSKAIEYLGHYNPNTKELSVDGEAAKKWLSVGAQPSDRVTTLLIEAKVLPESAKIKRTYKKKAGEKAAERADKKAEKQAKPEPKVEATPEPAAETTAE
jgi:small subunit ribosomal protein S16